MATAGARAGAESESGAGEREPWREEYLGGSPAAEAAVVRRLAARVLEVQHLWRRKRRAPTVLRAAYAKAHAGVTGAEFRVSDRLPAGLQVGFLKPGAVYPATVRFSNASGSIRPDIRRDLRGAAVRVHVAPDEVHDFLMANSPAAPARDAPQFVACARALAGSKLLALPRLLLGVGPSEAVRIVRHAREATAHPVRSVATERYWSRAPILWGARPVKYLIAPASGADPGPDPDPKDPDYLRAELARRLAIGPVVFDFKIQKYINSTKTPIEDASVEWREEDSPPVTVAQLVIPRQDLTTAAAAAVARQVDRLEFNPWHTTAEFRPLGGLNRARQMAYTASADHRLGYRFYRPPSLRNAVFGWLARALFLTLNRRVPWHQLPGALATLNLLAVRQHLRRHNLVDTEEHPDLPVPRPVPRAHPPATPNPARSPTSALGPGPFLPAAEVEPAETPHREIAPGALTSRTPDGTANDLADPHMGSAGARFGRNVPLHRAVPQHHLFLDPNPRRVSRALLARDTFKPARGVNLLAAAWLQFMTQGWFDHLRNPPGHSDLQIPLGPDDPWDDPSRTMRIRSTRQAAPGRSNPPRPPAFVNAESSWWDASQLYGNRREITDALRSGSDGKLRIGGDGLLPPDPDRPGADRTGNNAHWWLGLSLLHTLFVQEHNAVCDALRREYPFWDDEALFQKARLITAALLAKIHTVEWAPAALGHPALEASMNLVWSGAPRDWLTRFGVWLVEREALDGVPGALPDHHAAPYSQTEEFVAACKLHPLLPDDLDVHALDGDRPLGRKSLTEIQGPGTRDVLEAFAFDDLLYSFGVAPPGAVTLHNYPNALRHLETPVEGGGTALIDLATVDIVRERERGVPRYNDLRELLHLPRVASWDRLCSHPRWAFELRDVYGDIDKVDALVGLFAEAPPRGIGVGDTAVRLFLLSASRRLQSDRFFTVDYTPEVYTPAGLRWVEANGLKSVVLRHHPALGPSLLRVANAFKTWHRAAPHP